jgi:hypothetical protein
MTFPALLLWNEMLTSTYGCVYGRFLRAFCGLKNVRERSSHPFSQTGVKGWAAPGLQIDYGLLGAYWRQDGHGWKMLLQNKLPGRRLYRELTRNNRLLLRNLSL